MDYPDGKVFTCDICGQDFNCATILEMHIIEHSDQNKFQCTQCSKHFSRKDSLEKCIQP